MILSFKAINTISFRFHLYCNFLGFKITSLTYNGRSPGWPHGIAEVSAMPEPDVVRLVRKLVFIFGLILII